MEMTRKFNIFLYKIPLRASKDGSIFTVHITTKW